MLNGLLHQLKPVHGCMEQKSGDGRLIKQKFILFTYQAQVAFPAWIEEIYKSLVPQALSDS